MREKIILSATIDSWSGFFQIFPLLKEIPISQVNILIHDHKNEKIDK